MRIGFGAPVSGAWGTPESLARFASRAEELGYGSLWSFQRLLVPEDQKVAPVYLSVLDPLLSLTYAAALTSRIRLGVAIINLPFVSPTYLAKQASTLDVLSGGRLDLGLGTGWSPLEFAATGSSSEHRGARAEEYLRVLHTLFADEVSSFDGEFYTVPRSRMAPKPVQRPGPPVLMGGSAAPALRRAGRLSAGWMSRSATDLSGIGKQIEMVRAGAEEAGRDPAEVRVVVRGVVRAGAPVTDEHGERVRLSGGYDQIREDTAWLGEQGVTEIFYDLNWDPRVASPDLDPAAAVARAEEIMNALAPR